MADFDRFRSFAERYVIERAPSFTKGKEREEAWEATMDAKTIYGNIGRMAADAEPVIFPSGNQSGAAQAPTQQAAQPAGNSVLIASNQPLHPNRPMQYRSMPAPPAVTAPVTSEAVQSSAWTGREPKSISLSSFINAITGKESNGTP